MSAPKMLPALLGGLFIGVLSSLPFVLYGNACCCLWVVGGGALAAWLMQQNTPRPVNVGEGAIVGLLSGLVGTLVWIVIGLLILLMFSRPPFDLAEFQRTLSEAENTSPEARAAIESLTPAMGLVVGGFVFAVVSTVFATIGGLLGALVFRRKSGPAAGLPPAPPPTFTPPTFMPPTPAAPPPPFVPPPPSPPPAPPAGAAPLDADLTPPPGRPIDLPPPGSWPAPPTDDPYVGDAPTIMIPARGLNLPPSPKPPAPPAPPSAAVLPPDRDPESH